MPNGGSDCCGTCCFNAVNIAKANGQSEQEKTEPYCTIRHFSPETPFWTYCANHPHHNLNKTPVPVGSVYEDLDDGNGRTVKLPAPDSEEVRVKLLQLLEKISEQPELEYPTPTRFDREVIKHLQAIKESRASEGLIRLLSFDPFVTAGESFFAQNNVGTISHALEALACIDNDESIEHIRPWITAGLKTSTTPYNEKDDQSAPLRYHAVRALRFMSFEKAKDLLETAMQDPHTEINAFANGILVTLEEKESNPVPLEPTPEEHAYHQGWQAYWKYSMDEENPYAEEDGDPYTKWLIDKYVEYDPDTQKDLYDKWVDGMKSAYLSSQSV